MKTAGVKTIAIYLTTIMTCALMCISFFQREQIKQNDRIIKEAFISDSTKIKMLMDLLLVHGKYNNIPLKKEMQVVDSNNNCIKIGELIKKPLFIYHFDETNCFTCVANYLPYLKQLSHKLGKGNVLIIGAYEKDENLFLALKDYDLKEIPMYNMNPRTLKEARISKLNAPYIFMVDSALQCNRFFIPEKTLPELSELYFNNTAYNK